MTNDYWPTDFDYIFEVLVHFSKKSANELQFVSKKKLVVLSGAGVSAESGIATFRGSGGFWEGYDIMKVASPEGWAKDFKNVLNFYNARRRNIAGVKPNAAHIILAELEEWFDVEVITQNIDNLHEQAGSSKVIHLHGEITKACSVERKNNVKDIGFQDILPGQLCKDGHQLRPFIVWFGEDVPLIPLAADIVGTADIVLVIGTSLEVYPAAGLVNFTSDEVPIYMIDPESLADKLPLGKKVIHIREKATYGMKEFKRQMEFLR